MKNRPYADILSFLQYHLLAVSSDMGYFLFEDSEHSVKIRMCI